MRRRRRGRLAKRAVAERRELQEGLGLAAQLDLLGVGDVERGAVEADVGAEVPGGERGLVGGIAADEQDGCGGQGVAQRGGAVRVCRRGPAAKAT